MTKIYRHTLFCYASLYCASQILHFLQMKACGNPASSTFISTFFPTAFAHFVALCHILVMPAIFQTFSRLLYLLWWSVIRDFYITLVIVWGSQESYHVRQWTSSINIVCVLTASPTGHSPFSLSLSSSLPIPWDKTILKLGQLITLQWHVSVQMKWRVVHLSL